MWPFNRKAKEIHFKVGDVVKCIDDREWNSDHQNMKIVFGKTYKILQILKCPICGVYSYDIGCKFNDNILFTRCQESDMPGAGIHWAGEFRFEKYTENELSAEQVKEIIDGCVANQEFERAAEYKKLLELKE